MSRKNRVNFIGPPIEKVRSSAFRIPTATPESDGTFEWTSTTLALVEAEADGKTGIGFSYADTATAKLINDMLAGIVVGCDALSVGYCWEIMVMQIRNLGRPGICSMAISAVDNALWDLKARLLDMPLVSLLGQVRETVPVYGSGGFTSYSLAALQEQLVDWTGNGITRVKMKIGREPRQDVFRVNAVRQAIGADNELLSMPMALIHANRHWRWRKLLRMQACHGSRNRYPAMTWKACA